MKFFKKKFFSYDWQRVYVQKEIYAPTQTYSVQPAPQSDFDYRNFFDFGFFSNTAAGFGGSHIDSYPSQQTVNTINRKKRQTLESVGKPIVTYERNFTLPIPIHRFFLPQVAFRKFYSWPRFSITNLFAPSRSYTAPSFQFPTFYYRRWFIPNPSSSSVTNGEPNTTTAPKIVKPSTSTSSVESRVEISSATGNTVDSSSTEHSSSEVRDGWNFSKILKLYLCNAFQITNI